MDFDVANLVIAIVVPFLSVFAAQQMMRKDAKRQDVKQAFITVNRHLQEFLYAFMKLRRLPMLLPMGAVTKDDIHRNTEQRVQFEHALLDRVIDLENDCLMLGLIFDRKADFVGKKIRAYAHRADLLLDGNAPAPPPADDCFKLLRKDMTEITQDIKVLWKPFVAADELDE